MTTPSAHGRAAAGRPTGSEDDFCIAELGIKHKARRDAQSRIKAYAANVQEHNA